MEVNRFEARIQGTQRLVQSVLIRAEGQGIFNPSIPSVGFKCVEYQLNVRGLRHHSNAPYQAASKSQFAGVPVPMREGRIITEG